MRTTEHTLPELPELPPGVRPATKRLTDREHAPPAGKRRRLLLTALSLDPFA
jgi:hypothetical protein